MNNNPDKSYSQNRKNADTNFGSSDLSGKEVPDFISERFNSTINLIGDVSKNMQNICLFLIAISMYIVFALSHIEDQHMFIKQSQMELPILNIKMSCIFFLLPAQLLILCVFLFFQIYRKQIISLINGLPAIFPDGEKISNKLHPWILLMRLIPETQIKSNPISSAKLTFAFPFCLSWVLVPFISAMILFRTLKSQNNKLTISVWLTFLVTCLAIYISNKWIKSEGKIKTKYFNYKVIIFFIVIFLITLTLTVNGIKGNLLPLDLENAKLAEMELKEFNFRNAKLNDANLTKATLCETNMEYSSLNRAKCREANFSFASLKGAHLNYARLMDTKCISTKFIGARLIKANLSGANLYNADLRVSVLTFTNFSGANLKGVRFDGAKLNSTDFRGAKNLTLDQLEKAKTHCFIKCDQELKEQIFIKLNILIYLSAQLTTSLLPYVVL